MSILNFIKNQYIKIKINLSNDLRKSNIIRSYYGVNIGEGVRIVGNTSWGSEPYLITIGNNVTISGDVRFITHDGGVGLFRKEHKGINVFSKITVGNNVFIGARSIILPGVTIGDNVVIGAGSVVTKNIAENTVAAGVPARKIKTIEEYKNDCLNKAVYVFSNNPSARKEEILKAVKSEPVN